MEKQDLKKILDKLCKEHEEIENQIKVISNEMANFETPKGLSGDLVDMVNNSHLDDVKVSILLRAKKKIRKIELVFQKIEEGDYGYCESCGEEINEKRLLSRPTTEFCLCCQLEEERLQAESKGDFIKMRRIASDILSLLT